MKAFDIKRFGQTFIWNLKSSQKELFNITGILFIIFLVIPMLTLVFSPYAVPEAKRAIVISSTGVTVVVYSFFIIFSGCWVFSNMKTKPQRISFRMLPATDFDKFLSRFLYVTVIFYIGAVLAFVLADVVRMLFCLILWQDSLGSVLPHLFDEFHFRTTVSGMDVPASLNAMIIALSLWGHSFTILCGTVFRRRQVIFTGLSFIALSMLVGILGAWAGSTFSVSIGDDTGYFLLWVIDCVLVVIALFNYWLSYKLFSRMQVINNKWVNL